MESSSGLEETFPSFNVVLKNRILRSHLWARLYYILYTKYDSKAFHYRDVALDTKLTSSVVFLMLRELEGWEFLKKIARGKWVQLEEFKDADLLNLAEQQLKGNVGG